MAHTPGFLNDSPICCLFLSVGETVFLGTSLLTCKLVILPPASGVGCSGLLRDLATTLQTHVSEFPADLQSLRTNPHRPDPLGEHLMKSWELKLDTSMLFLEK